MRPSEPPEPEPDPCVTGHDLDPLVIIVAAVVYCVLMVWLGLALFA